MLSSVVEFYLELLYAVQCCYLLPRVITCCAMLLHVSKLLHVGQCCYTWHCVVEFRAAVLYVVMCSCMLCSVVACYQELLHAVQCC